MATPNVTAHMSRDSTRVMIVRESFCYLESQVALLGLKRCVEAAAICLHQVSPILSCFGGRDLALLIDGIC